MPTERRSTLWPWRRSVSTRLSSPSTVVSWAPFWTSAANSCTRPSSATLQPRATRGSTMSSITLPTVTSWQFCTAPLRFIVPTCRGSVTGSIRCSMRGASDLLLPRLVTRHVYLLSALPAGFPFSFFPKMTIVNICIFHIFARVCVPFRCYCNTDIFLISSVFFFFPDCFCLSYTFSLLPFLTVMFLFFSFFVKMNVNLHAFIIFRGRSLDNCALKCILFFWLRLSFFFTTKREKKS